MNFTDRQTEIIEVSISLLAKRGIQELTIKNISEAVGVSEPAIYRHFESKYEILFSVLSYFEVKSSPDLPIDASDNLNSLEKLESIVLERFSRFQNSPDLAKIIFSESIFQGDERLYEKMSSIMKHHKAILDKLITSAQREGLIRSDIAPKELFRMIFGSVRLLVTQWCMSGQKFNLMQEGITLWQGLSKMVKI